MMLQKPNCRFCDAVPVDQALRAKNVYGGASEHKFYECGQCGLVYLWPPLSENEERQFYSKEFEKFMEQRSGSERDWTGPKAHAASNKDNIARRLEFLKSYLSEGKSVLEIGCSSGFMIDAFRDLGLKTAGIELSGTFVPYLIAKGHEIYPDLQSLKDAKPNMKFDLITHFFVLEHIADTKGFFEEQLTLLEDTGMIVAEVPCVNDPLTSLYTIPAFENFYWSIAHHYYFSPKSISFILDRIKCRYRILPDQRYDLSNHLRWFETGKPGGQNYYSNIFSEDTVESYKRDLIDKQKYDTMFLYIWKQ